MNALHVLRWVRQVWAVAFQQPKGWSWRVMAWITVAPVLFVGAGWGLTNVLKLSGAPWEIAAIPLLDGVRVSLALGMLSLSLASTMWIRFQFHSPRYRLVPHLHTLLPWVLGVCVLLMSSALTVMLMAIDGDDNRPETWAPLWCSATLVISLTAASLRSNTLRWVSAPLAG